MQKPFVALGLTLKDCNLVRTLGVKPQFSDYSEDELLLLKKAPVILFPTFKYIPIFDAVKKATFPSASSYYYKRSIHLQFSLASYLNIPRLKTRFFAGKRQKSTVLDHFSLPLKVFTRRNCSRSYQIAATERELAEALSMSHSVIIQEIPHTQTHVGLVLLNFRFEGSTTPGKVDESIIRVSTRICKSAGIDDIVIFWVKAAGIWKFAGMGYPPQKIFTPSGHITTRKHRLCSMLRDILTGRESPPWTKNHATEI